MIDNLNDNSMANVLRRLRALETADLGGFTSITRGQFRVGGSAILLVDSDGGLIIQGTLNGDGTITWEGPVNLNGDTTISGTLDVSGITTLLNNLIIGAGGKITAGAVTVDPGAGGTGGLSSASAIRFASPQVFTTGDLVVGDDLNVSDQASIGADLNVVGDIFGNSKNFLIPHPVKAGKLLRHGSTESPTHGIEYVGVASLDASGEALIRLPEYFEALALPEGRTVHVTAIGRPFTTGSELPAGGQFRVYGEPGREVSWLVRASRGTFEVEPEVQAS